MSPVSNRLRAYLPLQAVQTSGSTAILPNGVIYGKTNVTGCSFSVITERMLDDVRGVLDSENCEDEISQKLLDLGLPVPP